MDSYIRDFHIEKLKTEKISDVKQLSGYLLKSDKIKFKTFHTSRTTHAQGYLRM